MEPFEQYTERYEKWFERNRSAYRSELKAVDELLADGGEGSFVVIAAEKPR